MSLLSVTTCRLLDIGESIARSVSLEDGTPLINSADVCSVTAGPVWHASSPRQGTIAPWADGAVGYAQEAVEVSLHGLD